MKYLDGWVEKRRENAKIYDDLLSNVPDIELPVETPYAKRAPWVYVIRTKKRDKLKDNLQQKGIETAITYPVPIHLQKAFSYLGLKEGSYPITEKYSREILALPVHPGLDEQQVHYITAAIETSL